MSGAHTNNTLLFRKSPKLCIMLTCNLKSPIFDKVCSQMSSIAQILVYEIIYNVVTKLKKKEMKFGNNETDTC